MKKLFTLIACIVLLGSFTACSDKDDDRIDEGLLIGSWQQTAVYDGQTDEWYPETDILVLNTDGTGYQALSFTTTYKDNFTWHCAGNTLVLDFGGKYADISERRVETLTNSELVLAQDYEDEDGRACTDRAVYERVK